MAGISKSSGHSCFGGVVGFYSHHSEATATPMNFSVYLPPQTEERRVPVLYYLAGLTATEETFQIKGAAHRHAAQEGLMLVCPDTSPRGANIEGEDDDYDLGTGAGFYIDATAKPWSQHYNMHTYITQELRQTVAEHFPARPDSQGIFGHSMGGHGALTLALKNPELYASISAFAPICNPSRVPWGRKAFSSYLAEGSQWEEHDASELVRTQADNRHILIDQGLDDQFLEEQLSPEVFEVACEAAGQPLTLRCHEGYDHSYYFISTFMEDHISHHAKTLNTI